MKKITTLFSFLIYFWLAAPVQALQLGVDRVDIYGPLLEGKKVALLVNQSSLDSQGKHDIDKLLGLQEKYHFKLTALFSAEHGIRGKVQAGFGDNDSLDAKSGLPIISLYGYDKNGRFRGNPTAEQLDNVDVVIFDLQDVGVRFYTYTVYLHYLMESLQAYDKSLMVFDRPNPLGKYVYGPLLEEENISGIGIDPVPMVHGLTVGEFASMIVGEKWLTGFDHKSWDNHDKAAFQFKKEKLTVIKMTGYKHSDFYHLPVAPSPNLRTDLAIALYPSLALFESSSVNTGRGSDYPFEQLGFPDKHFYQNTSYLVNPNIAKTGWPQAGEKVYGRKFEGNASAYPPSIRYFVEWWDLFHKNGYQTLIDKKDYLNYQNAGFIIRPMWLAKLTGTEDFLKALEALSDKPLSVAAKVELIEKTWQKDIKNYTSIRKRYLMYPE